jgi:hypothetical protein
MLTFKKTSSVLILASALLSGTALFANNAAIVLQGGEHPFGCWAFGLYTPDAAHTVSTSSGNTKLICHFDVPVGMRPTKAQSFQNFGCGIYLPSGSLFTSDSSFISTPGGKAKLECTVKGNL